MAIINSLAVGKARNSAGNLTFSTVEGRTIAREKPQYVRNPNTAAQQAQRSLMAAVVAGWRVMGANFKKLWTSRKKYTSAYNAFVSANIANAVQFNYDAATGKVKPFAGLVLGSGKYPAASMQVNTSDNLNFTVVSSNDELKANAKVGDVVGLVIYDVDKDVTHVREEILDSFSLAAFKNSGYGFLFSAEIASKLAAGYYFSPSKNESSSVILS